LKRTKAIYKQQSFIKLHSICRKKWMFSITDDFKKSIFHFFPVSFCIPEGSTIVFATMATGEVGVSGNFGARHITYVWYVLKRLKVNFGLIQLSCYFHLFKSL